MPESYVDFDTPAEKAEYVRNMFDRISPRYDLLNRVMTGGQDIRWRRLAIEKAAVPAGGLLLDIACGTGDLAFAGLRRNPALVAAADFSLKMVQLGHRKRNGLQRLHFLGADGLVMPFRQGSFDAVVTGFSMRNVTSVDAFLAEMTRVVRPAGRVVVLEITPIKSRLFRWLFRLYFHRLVPRLGSLLGGDREAYTYLPQSVDIFLTADELKMKMQAAGLQEVHYQKLSFGTVALHWGTVAR